jgi:hypothetical protein
MEAYDITYGHCTHENDNEPLSLVSLHPTENIFLGGKLEQTIRAFRVHKVGSHMQMSLTEFLALPRYVTKMILRDCENAEKKEGEIAKNIMDGMR